jgi:menaquinone-9 beta-reductase
VVERLKPRADVLVAGAGPAGAAAALVLAQAGLQVTIFDRARFPRHKLCGDTLNPGTIAHLRRLAPTDDLVAGAVRIDGMRLTGPGRADVTAIYPRGLAGAAITRQVFDARLLDAAVRAGASFEEGVTVLRPLLDERSDRAGRCLVGLTVKTAGGTLTDVNAPVVIAADGRGSALASAAGLSATPATPRRWAIGAYYRDADVSPSLGEMHVRRDHYVGVAPVPGDLANVILVVPSAAARAAGAGLAGLLDACLRADAKLAPRFHRARQLGRPVVLGPLGVNAPHPGCEGLLLAGDAAGFIDPITGDGMRFAVLGGELAALSAIEALDRGWNGLVERLAAARRRAFGPKQRFNRALRLLTASPAAIAALSVGAPLLSPFLRRLILVAGDVPISLSFSVGRVF